MWNLDFIDRNDFKKHVSDTIKTYDNTLKGIDLHSFNSNIIDPIKLTFDSKVYRKTIEEVIENELVRQRDKTNTNAIGYFHQNLFKYIDNCEVPNVGFDVIYTRPNGSRVYVEMKNKHNTMNSSAAGKTYIKMQSQLLEDDDCACFLVEAIAKKSQNIKWSTTVDGKNVSHKKIRRVSLDQFYALVTGENDALYQMCMVLPKVIEKVVADGGDDVKIPHDSVFAELKRLAGRIGKTDEDIAMAMAIYLLGFSTYLGFSKVVDDIVDGAEDSSLKHIYEYAKRFEKTIE